jgi:hypothetical protein
LRSHCKSGASATPCRVPPRRTSWFAIWSQAAAQPAALASATVQAVALDELLEGEQDIEHPYSAILISERLADFQPGEAVVWIELLSPTNKGDTKDAYTYHAKRHLWLEKGLVFVELDSLHETPPTFDRLRDYSRGAPDTYAYRMVVVDPRPAYRDARASVYEFDVDAPLPIVTIPLNAGDQLKFDFDAVYHKTFREALYGYDMDYAELPVNFERYSAADQTRIARRMLAVLTAQRAGLDLETGPFPVETIALDEALKQITNGGGV